LNDQEQVKRKRNAMMGDRLVWCEAGGQRLTFRIQQTNTTNGARSIPRAQKSGGPLILQVKIGLLKYFFFECNPPDSTFWGVHGTRGDFGAIATITINPGMSAEYFLAYDMPESDIEAIRKGETKQLKIDAILLQIVGKLREYETAVASRNRRLGRMRILMRCQVML
jgi:hypothetical protein